MFKKGCFKIDTTFTIVLTDPKNLITLEIRMIYDGNDWSDKE